MNNKAEYDYEAANYDKSRFTDNMGRHLDYMHKKILVSLLDPSNKLLLEAGVGTGRFATWLAKKGFGVVGIDISREMLKKAKEKKEILNVDIGLILADIHSLPFRKGVFDSCICINVLDHVYDIGRFLKEARYVIKPKGSLIFNFSNPQSPYLPIAIVINLTKLALFKSGRIYSRWLTLREIDTLLSTTSFDINELRGCMIASPIPLAEKLVKVVQVMNSYLETSKFRLFCGSVFVKAQPSAESKFDIPQ